MVVEAKAGPWQYHSEVLTDQTPEEVCANIVREKLLENLRQEVPYTMTQVTEPKCLSAEMHLKGKLVLLHFLCQNQDFHRMFSRYWLYCIFYTY